VVVRIGMPAPDHAPGASGSILVHGPMGMARRILVSREDSPASIEHCLRAAFKVPPRAAVLLTNSDGLVVPLGVGLLAAGGGDGAAGPAPFKLEVSGVDEPAADGDPSLSPNRLHGWRPTDEEMAPSPSVSAFEAQLEDLMTPRGPGDMPAGDGVAADADRRSDDAPMGILPQLPNVKIKMAAKGLSGEELRPGANGLPAGGGDRTTADSPRSLPVFDVAKAYGEQPPGAPSAPVLPLALPQKMVASASCASADSNVSVLATWQEVKDELRFWHAAAAGYQKVIPGCKPRPCRTADGRHVARRHSSVSNHSLDEEISNLSLFDSSDQRIENLYRMWSGRAPLHPDRLRRKMFDEYGLGLSAATMAEALNRVAKTNWVELVNDEFPPDVEIDRVLFGGLWQRLMLGAVCRRAMRGEEDRIMEEDIELIEYSETSFDKLSMAEEQMLFRTPLVIPGLRHARKPMFSRWVRTTAASADRLLRLGVKFFLHPVAVSDAITAARIGMTKIDRYNHQYFMSLEVYALSARFHSADSRDNMIAAAGRHYMQATSSSRSDFMSEPMEVGRNIFRSVMFIVATGNPLDRHRNWLISVVNTREEGMEDPLNFFECNDSAAVKVLDDVYDDLEAGGRPREYAADFLMYTIIDRSAKQVTPICLAYGHRISWLRQQQNNLRLRMPATYVDEVSQMRLEMQELCQWIGQLRGILKTLTTDCKALVKNDGVIPWNFGAHAEGKGKSLLLFLSSTDATLEQSLDRMTMLDDLAKTFLDDTQRHREAFMNNILLTLTVATAVFMPAQLLAGIYGTNFVDEDGEPGIPELKWKYGYVFFLLSSIGIIMFGLVLAFVCLRKRR